MDDRPNAWAWLPVCACGFRIGPGDRCARCHATYETLINDKRRTHR